MLLFGPFRGGFLSDVISPKNYFMVFGCFYGHRAVEHVYLDNFTFDIAAFYLLATFRQAFFQGAVGFVFIAETAEQSAALP